MDSGEWLTVVGDSRYDALAEFDTWESGFDFSDAPPTFDEAAAARVSCTPLTDEERAAAEEVPLTCDDLIDAEREEAKRRQPPQRLTADDLLLIKLWEEHDEIIFGKHKRKGRRWGP